MKNILFLIVGLMMGTMVSVAFAKYESGTNDAASVVGYGKTSAGVLVSILVDSSGNIQ